MSGFWDRLPSLVVEIASGALFVLAGVLTLFCARVWPVETVAGLATIGSFVYEFKFDSNPDGKFRDILERQVGILVGSLLYALLA